eukprot:Clim_evm21s227 gene=Clim_evmTU21s227
MVGPSLKTIVLVSNLIGAAFAQLDGNALGVDVHLDIIVPGEVQIGMDANSGDHNVKDQYRAGRRQFDGGDLGDGPPLANDGRNGFENEEGGDPANQRFFAVDGPADDDDPAPLADEGDENDGDENDGDGLGGFNGNANNDDTLLVNGNNGHIGVAGGFNNDQPAGQVGEDMEQSGWSALFMGSAKGSFYHGFIASFMMNLVSEIGDKTFFIAAIMAMRHKRLLVFAGALSALAIMTALSVFLGRLTTFVPHIYTHYASIALFVVFGLRMIREGYTMSDEESQEEMEEAAAEVKASEEEYERRHRSGAHESGISLLEKGEVSGEPNGEVGSHNMIVQILEKMHRVLSPIWDIITACVDPVVLSAFTLTFVAEWGDRSQITTIVLGTQEDPLGVTLGGIMGHALCTGGAVMGGKMLAQRISVRTVHLVGGIVFLFFALAALASDAGDDAGGA